MLRSVASSISAVYGVFSQLAFLSYGRSLPCLEVGFYRVVRFLLCLVNLFRAVSGDKILGNTVGFSFAVLKGLGSVSFCVDVSYGIVIGKHVKPWKGVCFYFSRAYTLGYRAKLVVLVVTG